MNANGLRLTTGAVLLGVMVMASGCGSTMSAKGPAGCTSVALASVGPVTGPDSSNGRPPRNGAELAVRKYNTAHPGCPVGLLTYDTQGIPNNALNLADRIVSDPQIVGIIGPVFSGETAAMLPITDKGGVPEITASATNPSLAQNGWPTFHRIVGNDAAQGPAAALFMTERLGVHRVAVVDDTGLYGKTIADLATKNLKTGGAVVPVRVSVDPESVNYPDAIAAIAGAHVDAVYFGGVSKPGGRLLRQMRDAGITVPFVGGDGIYTPDFIDDSGGASSGAIMTCPCVNSSRPTTTKQTAFAESYRNTFGVDPGYFAAEYYDDANLFLDAISAGQTTRAGIGRWLGSANSAGLTKTIEFSGKGEVKAGAVFVFQVDGQGNFVPTAEVRNGKLVK